MPKVIEGSLSAQGLRLAIVASRFNSFIGERLVEGALDAIRRCGGDAEGTEVYRTPGAFEIPPVARRVATSGRCDGVICVGAVIRGATTHFEHVCAALVKGLADVQLSCEVPIAFGVLTPDTVEQAIERAGTKAGNKGFDAALAAIEMADLYRKMREAKTSGLGD